MGKLKAGETFGFLTLIEKLKDKTKHGAKLWRCKCVCGNEKIVSSGKVRAGHSCGCVALAKNKSRGISPGSRHGNLLVIRRLETCDQFRNRNYLCQCDCGNQKVVSSHGLSNGTKSCGCLKPKLKGDEAAFNQLYLNYKYSALRRGLDFNITKTLFREIIQLQCHYCGTEPLQLYSPKNSSSVVVYNGIDRFDSSEGYYEQNCVPCCGRCNKMKLNLSSREFIEHVCSIFKHQKAVAGG